MRQGLKAKDLDPGKKYAIVELQKVQSQYGEAILILLKEGRMFLPKSASQRIIKNSASLEELKELTRKGHLFVYSNGNDPVLCIQNS